MDLSDIRLNDFFSFLNVLCHVYVILSGRHHVRSVSAVIYSAYGFLTHDISHLNLNSFEILHLYQSSIDPVNVEVRRSMLC